MVGYFQEMNFDFTPLRMVMWNLRMAHAAYGIVKIMRISKLIFEISLVN